MDHDDQAISHGRRTWRRRAAIAFAVFSALLLIFHRPLLLTLGERVAAYLAAREHLKFECRLEGNVFTRLIARNLHITPTGPSPVESIDADFVRADYSLFALIRHGLAGGVRDAEVRSARVVINPKKALHKPKPDERDTLYDIFPEHVRISGGTLIIRDTPHDFVAENIDLVLDPRSAGELRIARLQMMSGQSWTQVSGQTSYANKNAAVRQVRLGDDRIELLNIDASHIEQRTLAMSLESAVGGGKLSGSSLFSETTSSLNARVHLVADHVDASAINKYTTLPEGTVAGEVERFTFDGNGLMNSPRTWTGNAAAQLNQFQSQGMTFDRCDVHVSARDGRATLESAETAGENRFEIHGSAELPKDIKEFGRTPASFELSAAALDLQRATAGLPQHLSGSAQMTGKVEIRNAKIDLNLNVSASDVGFKDGKVEKFSATITASKIVPPASVQKPWFADLRSVVALEVSDVRFREYAFDSVQGALQSTEDLLKIQQLLVKRRQNEFVIHGEYRLPADVGNAAHQPAAVDLAFTAPELADYWQADSPNKISGPLQMNGQVTWKQGVGDGQLSIYGSNLRMRNLVFRQVSSQWSMASSVLYVNDFTAALNDRDFLSAHGFVDLRPPFRYTGKISTSIADLSTFKPILQVSGNKSELGGTFVMDWEGKGELRTIKNSGKLNLTLEKGRYADLQSLQARVDATYTPDGLDVPIIFLANDRMDFQAVAQAKGETFEISKIQLDQGKAKYASGYISIPFVWKNLGSASPLFPPKGNVTVNFLTENIEIKKLFEDLGLKSATSGILYMNVDAHGTLDRVEARFAVQARDLRSEKAPNLEPATFLVTGETKNNQLNITGKVQQAKIQPVEITASLPCNVARVLSEHGLRDDTAVTGSVRLPRSSVNFLRQFVPQVVQLDGDLALNVGVRGTIGQPVLSGAGDITINVARAENVTLPVLRDFKARIIFTNDSLKVEQFGGDLSGGKFTLTGGVKFTKLTEANIDMQLKASSVLVARNDTLTARADADLKVTGRFMSATVAGTVALTNSQFLKNLDLIPIGLPGRPAPQPPAARPEFSFPDPPLRDWKFDVAIKTKDPFLLRGNLARGGVVSDLHLIGTGLKPGLEGLIRLESVEATLPFSRLEISYGFLYFDPSDSLNPKIDMHGTSVIRDYTIHVYIYGTTLAPQAVFSSEPPLPQEEIISLLATGATREELTGNSDVLAGRAAMLLVQQLYRKIVNKGEGTRNTSVFDRLDMDVGQIDPRTGERRATARFKVNDHFVLVGDVEVGGSFRGMVKYLIRFH